MNTSDALTGFVDQLNVPASSFATLAPASSAFPSLAYFYASSTSEALRWTDLVQDAMNQIVSTRTVNTQHRQSIICLSRKLMDPAIVLGHVVCKRKSCCKTLWRW